MITDTVTPTIPPPVWRYLPNGTTKHALRSGHTSSDAAYCGRVPIPEQQWLGAVDPDNARLDVLPECRKCTTTVRYAAMEGPQ